MSFLYVSLAQARGVTPLRAWTAAHIVTMFSIAVLAMLGFIIYSEISEIKSPEEDTSWAASELGFEHQRLLLAAERGDSLDDIRLHGDLYMSRVMILRDSPMLAEMRKRMTDTALLDLYTSAQATAQLIGELDRVEARDALLWQIRSDAITVRELMLDVASLNRRISVERRIEHSRQLLMYLVGLEVLTLALLGLSILVFRVTRRLRETGRELAQQLATQDAILNSVDSAIIGIGSRGSVLYSNPIAVALLGAWAARGTQLSCDEEVHGLAGDMKALVCDARAGGGASSVRKVQHAAEGRTRHYVIRASHTPTRDAAEEDARSPESTAHIVTVTDVTEAEEAALQRDEYDVRLGEASRLLAYAAISGGIVHEISQPLAAIRNYVYALKVSFNIRHVSAEYRAIADHLGEEVDRAIEVVRNVRNLGPANLQDGGVCDVQEVLAHSVRLATLGCSPSPPVIVCDGGSRALIAGSLPMVGQVIVNLLRNALSASSDAGRTGAEVAVRFHDHQAMILVADHGHGVSPEAAKSMFQPFSKSTRGGMGLGLAICQRIATSLGGSLSWENRQGGGAIFKFTVPLAKEGIVQ